MSNSIFSADDAYKFLKVEEYFARYKEWEKLEKVTSHSLYLDESDDKALTFDFEKSDGQKCTMLIQFLQQDIFRLRFRPDKNPTGGNPYTDINTRSAVTNTFKELRKFLEAARGSFSIQENQVSEQKFEFITNPALDSPIAKSKPSLKLVVNYNPFTLEVFHRFNDGREFRVWKTATPGIYYTGNGDEYAIIQAVNKPGSAKYIGFGEQGGMELYKNTDQLNYFNYDNMRYRQIYNEGPLDHREPLYHSDPFFMEFNGVCDVGDEDSLYGIFIDNTSQVLMDIGHDNSSRYLFGIRFGELDYYFMLGQEAKDILECFTCIVGKERLKPRYALGYHQGCYGYENRGALEWVVGKYRQHQIPLDGLHVDVDIQNNYQTFTIDENKFPNPQEMFGNLKAKGVKCSTNITPIISNRDINYTTYKEGRDNNYFVLDRRLDNDRTNQNYNGGYEQLGQYNDAEGNFNSGNPYIGEVYYGGNRGTTGHYADLARPEVRQWWGRQYQFLFNMGLEMVWQDMTTPAIRDTRGDMKAFPFKLMLNSNQFSQEDETGEEGPPQEQLATIKIWNLYSYNLHKATYQGLNQLAGRENEQGKKKRNLIIGRGSFAGMHRWAGLWTGDNSSSWDFLKMNVSQVLSVGMCGLSICGQDIGGFEREYDWEQWASPELLMRWTAAGAFLPWFRNHYIRKGQKDFQEPFMYEDWFYEQGRDLPEPQDLYRKVRPICQHYIELRYRLMQLFYDAMFESVITGLPICRPMLINDPQDKAIYNDQLKFLNNQFFVRDDLLVAPILRPESENEGKRDVYLPAGSNWYGFMDNKFPLSDRVEGGTTINFEAILDNSYSKISFIVPIYVREGAIIPTIELEQYVNERNKTGQLNPITLNIYPGSQGQYTMYLDDGESRASAKIDPLQDNNDPEAKEEYREVKITHQTLNATTREIKIERVHDNYTPLEPYFFVAPLHDPQEPKGSNGPLMRVTIAGQAITLKSDSDALNSANTNAWYYNPNINISSIKVFDNSPSITITLEYLT
ncbi:MAG: glycoside hydrolase family 31 protein [Pleurocapsa sp. MO_226.B13]|nr:glycoside hydrolase family 31 protein [Pleurocapsa sp. MO_226.B13]